MPVAAKQTGIFNLTCESTFELGYRLYVPLLFKPVLSNQHVDCLLPMAWHDFTGYWHCSIPVVAAARISMHRGL